MEKEVSAGIKETVFPGKYAYLPKEVHAGRIIAVKYAFKIKAAVKARIMFSTKLESKVFIDGKFICKGCRLGFRSRQCQYMPLAHK